MRKILLLCLLLYLSGSVFAAEKFHVGNLSELTPKKIESMLKNPVPRFGEPFSRSGYWECHPYFRRLGKKEQNAIHRKIIFLRKNYRPAFSDADWKQGTYSPYGKALETANYLLNLHLMLEAIERKGTEIPAILNLLQTLCSAKTWVVHHHDKSEYAFSGKGRFIALETSRIGASVSTATFLLGDQVPRPLQEQCRKKVREWLIEPYLAAVRAKKPEPQMAWINASSNWNPACHSGVLISALSFAKDKAELTELFYQSARHLIKYLDSSGSDGFCKEGPSYWQFGMNHYLLAAHLLRHATGGNLDLFDGSEKIRQIINYLPHLEMDHGLYPAYGDSPAFFRLNSIWISTVFYWRYGTPAFRSLALGIYRGFPYWQSMALLLAGAEIFAQGKETPSADTAENAPGFLFLSSNAAASRPKRNGGLSLSLFAGSNDVPHNHNDVGTFVIGKNSEPMIVDSGYPRYHWKSFSAARYESDICNSYGHSVPLINQIQQKAGKGFEGKILSARQTAALTEVTADIRNAYPKETGLLKLHRTWFHDRENDSIQVIDEAELNAAGTFETALISYGNFLPDGKNKFRIKYKNQEIHVSISTDSGELEYSVSPIQYKLENKLQPYRLGCRFKEKQKSFRLIMKFKNINAGE